MPEIHGEVRVFVDVGASLGQYTYFAAKALEGAKFYCVEADPYKAHRLRELWAQETGNEIEVVEKAASDRDEVISFFVPKNHSRVVLFSSRGSAEGWDKVG